MSYNNNDYQPSSGKVIKSDGTVVNEGDGYNADGSLNVQTTGHKSLTIQTQNGVSIPASGTNASSWIDCSGFSTIAITMQNDANTSCYGDINWSHDGVTYHSSEYAIIPSNTTNKKAVSTAIKARYARVVLNNGDSTTAHVMSGWAYLLA